MLYRNFQFTPADYITIVSHDIYIRNPKTLYTNKDADRNKEIDSAMINMRVPKRFREIVKPHVFKRLKEDALKKFKIKEQK